MESNECICFNYLMKQFESFMISLANTLGQITINRNSPANDSGYYRTNSLNANPNNFNISNFLTGVNLNNAVFSVIIIGVIVLLLTGNTAGKKRNPS